MAQRKSTKGNDEMDQPGSPTELLQADHDKVRELFDEYEAAGDRKTKAKQHIVEEVCTALEIHTKLEEEIFYPAIKALGEKEGNKLIAESIEEHQVVKNLIEEIRELDSDDEQYEAKFTVLMENVKHHIEEEEQEMFPLAEEELGDVTDSLLEEMLERRQALQATH